MSDRETIRAALLKADAAGDVEAARKLAAAYRALSDQPAAPQDEAKARAKQNLLRIQGELDTLQYDPMKGMSFPEVVGTSFDQGVSKAGRGARQALAAIMGDEETLSRLNAEESDLEAIDKRLTSAAGPVSEAASFTGQYVAPALATGVVGKVAQAPAWLARTGVAGATGRAALGAGVGAVEGYIEPLTQAQEAAGDRTANTITSAALGGGTVLGLEGLRGLKEMWRKGSRSLPREEIKKLAVQLGYDPNDAVMGKNLEDLRKAVEDKFQTLSRQSDEAYAAIELNPELPPVTLSPQFSSMMQDAMSNPNSLYELSKDKRVRDAYAALSGAQGQPLTFRQVRDLQRSIKEQASRLGGKNPLWDMVNALDSELDNWATKGSVDMQPSGLQGLPGAVDSGAPMYPGAVGVEDLYTKPSPALQEALDAARTQDAWYRENIGPMVNKGKSALASFRGGYEGNYPAGKEGLYLPTGTRTTGSTALNTKDLLERVPEARDPMRKLLAEQLMIPDQDTALAKRLHTLPLGVADSPESAIRAQELARAISEEEAVPAFLRAKFPMAGDFIHRYMNGVDPAGFVPPAGVKLTPEMLTAMLLSGAGVNATSDSIDPNEFKR